MPLMEDRQDIPYQMDSRALMANLRDDKEQVDNLELSILQQIHKRFKERIDYFNSPLSVDMSESELKVKQQIYHNQRVATSLAEEMSQIDLIIKENKGRW